VNDPAPASRPARRATRIAAYTFAALAAGVAIHAWLQRDPAPQFITESPESFAALFEAPPAPDSATTRHELDELLQLQASRTPAEVAAARADRKTEVTRFADALGLAPEKMAELKALQRFAEAIEDEIRPFVRAAKERFRRLRPYEIEPGLQPCIDHVRGDLSYPSGHATYGYAMAFMLIDMVPERTAQLRARASQFARQRMVCGVHFPSDINAGLDGARWLMQRIQRAPNYRAESEAARRELRAAMGLNAELPATAPALPAAGS